MTFANKLQNVMIDLNLTQAQVSELTNIGRSSISQYLSGKNAPTKARKKEMAAALGLDEYYFFQEPEEPAFPHRTDRIPRLLPEEAAQIMGMSKETIMAGLRDGVFPWGYAIPGTGTRWVYFINKKRFYEIEGLEMKEGNE